MWGKIVGARYFRATKLQSPKIMIMIFFMKKIEEKRGVNGWGVLDENVHLYKVIVFFFFFLMKFPIHTQLFNKNIIVILFFI